MKRSLLTLVLLCVTGAAPVLSGAGTPGPSAPPAVVADSLSFSLEVGNRLYPEWKEAHDVGMDEMFYLGDTEYTAAVERFIPDFRIIDGRPVSFSDSLANPAAYVFVYGDSGAVDSSWAFLNFAPHFSPKSFFTFRLLEVKGYRSSVPVGEQ